MWLGIDFGTTNTSAAIYDGHKLNYIPLDRQNESPHNLRSMIYIDTRQQVRVGVDAIQTFLREDTGRPVVLEERVVGTIENTVARQERGISDADDAITIVYDVTAHEDAAIRGRLLQSIKTALRSPSYQGTRIFAKYYTVEELIALILGHVKREAEAHLKRPLYQAVIGRPVTFCEDAGADRMAEEKIRHAAHLAGFTHCIFVPEPVAAAAFYAARSRRDETIFVFDFGGGTLDLTLMRLSAPGEQEVLASHGVLVGGDDLDSAIMRGKLASYFGAQSSIDTNFDGRPVPFPQHLAELLEQWQTIPVLTRPQHLEVIRRGARYGDNRSAFAALEALATKNYGFALFQAIEEGKCTLSGRTSAAIQLDMDAIRLHVEITRGEFSTLISREKAQVRQGIRDTIAASGVQRDQINAIVVTGGSSAIPAFQSLLKAEMPQAQLVVSDRFGSVTGGLAYHAHTLC